MSEYMCCRHCAKDPKYHGGLGSKGHVARCMFATCKRGSKPVSSVEHNMKEEK